MGNEQSTVCFLDGDQWRCKYKSSSGDTSERTVTHTNNSCDTLSDYSGITRGALQELMKEQSNYKDNYAINWMTSFYTFKGLLGKREVRCAHGEKWNCKYHWSFAFRADCTLHENAVHGDEWWCLQGGQPPLGRRGIRYMKIAVRKAEEAKKK